MANEHFPSAPRSARTGTEYHTLGTMSVTSFAARSLTGLQGTPRHHQTCVKGTRQGRQHGGRRTLAVVRSAMSETHHDDADVVSAARHHNAEEGEDNNNTDTAAPTSAAAPPTSRRDLMTAAISLAATATTAPFVSAASAAEPTLVRGRWADGGGAIEYHLESKKIPPTHRETHTETRITLLMSQKHRPGRERAMRSTVGRMAAVESLNAVMLLLLLFVSLGRRNLERRRR